MRITLTKRGGQLATFNPTSSFEVPASDSRSTNELNSLVAQVAAERPVDSAHRIPDDMSYTITIEREGEAPLVLKRNDGNMTRAFADLLDWCESRLAK